MRTLLSALVIFCLLFTNLISGEREQRRSSRHPVDENRAHPSLEDHPYPSSIDSLNLRVAGRWPFGPSYTVAIDSIRQLTFLGSGGGIYILDTSNPANPLKVSEITTPGIVEDLSYSEDHLYTAVQVGDSYDGSLRIISVTDPGNPTEVAVFPTHEYAQAVAVEGDYACVVDRTGLTIVSVANPSEPFEISYYDFPGWGYRKEVAIKENYVYLVSHDLTILSVHDPANPVEVGTYDPGNFDEDVRDVSIQGDYAYVVSEQEGYSGYYYGHLRIISIADPANPFEVGGPSGIYGGNFSDPGFAVDVHGEFAYTVAGDLRVFSISDPENPVLVGTCDDLEDPWDVIVLGDYAYVADDRDGLKIVSISNPHNPYVIGSYDTPDRAIDVAVNADFAYLAGGRELRSISISDPGRMTEVGIYRAPDEIRAIALANETIYLVDDRFRVISVSDPENLIEVGSCDYGGDCADIDARGEYAYIAASWRGMRVMSATEPENPRLVSIYDPPDARIIGIDVNGPYAYILHNRVFGGEMEIVSIWDPEYPVGVSSLGWGYSYPLDIAVNGDHACIVNEWDPLRIVSISNPSNPYYVADYELGSQRRIAMRNELAYIATGSQRLAVLSIAKPENPVEVGYHHAPGDNSDVAVNKSFAFLADGEAGLLVFDYYGPTSIEDREENHMPLPGSFSLSQNYPNPFNPCTTMEVSVPRNPDGPTSLMVYDLRGRHVRTLVDEILEPGRYTLTWDGKTNAGIPVASGVYILNLRNGPNTLTRKMTVVE